jgi:hypothetical protein
VCSSRWLCQPLTTSEIGAIMCLAAFCIGSACPDQCMFTLFRPIRGPNNGAHLSVSHRSYPLSSKVLRAEPRRVIWHAGQERVADIPICHLPAYSCGTAPVFNWTSPGSSTP